MLKTLLKQKAIFSLPDLPYDQSVLEPYVSAKTVSFHYGKHHATYVSNLNALIAGTPYADMTLEELILATYQKPDKLGIYNNAAQVWNHAFFWHSMKQHGGGNPSGDLLVQLTKDFGSIEAFAEEFKKAAISQFGSGWAWLISDNGSLKIAKTSNADLPLVSGQKALLTIDVWEHSYYLDYQNRRADYLGIFIEKLVNWSFVEENFASQA